ncbi:hypothetical protein [Microbacterium sp.]|uniref:hypothetical protein n=1 Tax=Microbacterium sp. TaxID=51671 RepID=UPI0037CA8524
MNKRDYLAFGGSPAAAAVDIAGSIEYLKANGFGNGYLERARGAVDAHRTRAFEFEPLNANYCDFCFAKLMGGEFDRLADGRERCMRCTRSVLRTGEDFELMFAEVKRNFEAAFQISINAALMVRMVNAKEIARRSRETFQPTPGVDARALGFAEQHAQGYSLFIENGSPRLAAISTTAHELAHIWQYLNWNVGRIEQRYGAHHRLAVYEGMAAWAQVQYLLHIQEFDGADRQESYVLQRTDEYGVGFRMFIERYPLSRDGDVDIDTPFRHPHPL